MSDTPRTDAAYFQPDATMYDLAGEMKRIERELNAANAIIRQQQLLEEENLRLQGRIKLLESVTNDPHALWANWLRGSVTLPVGIGDVRQYQERIKRLEEDLMDAKNQYAALVADVALYEDRGERIKRLEDIISRAAYAFYRDGSDGQVASGMLTILEEVRKL